MDVTKILLYIGIGFAASSLYYLFRWLFSRFIGNEWAVRLLTFVLTLGICFTAVILIKEYVLQ